MWHGNFDYGDDFTVDELYNHCAGEPLCVGVVRNTATNPQRAAMVANWPKPAITEYRLARGEQLPVVDKIRMANKFNPLIDAYDYDTSQKGLGVRLGDCTEGTFETNIDMGYVADWAFEITTTPDGDEEADATDYMDIYVRADGEEDYVQLARHHNNVVKSVKVRLPATRYFDFKVFSKSSSMMMPRHMRIQSSPVALATQQGDVKLVYDLIGPTCVAGADASVCALVLFAVDRHTGQVRVRTANQLNVKQQAKFDLVVRATDPGGLFADGLLRITVIESNDPPKMYPFVLHVDENTRGREVWDLSLPDHSHMHGVLVEHKGSHWDTVPGDFTHAIAGADYHGVVGYVGSPSDVQKGQQLRYTIAAGNVNTQFEINAVTGVFSMASTARLDFETQSKYELSVMATDDGMGNLARAATTTVYVHDVNEHPWFPSTTRYVKEMSPKGTPCGEPVQGMDNDAGDKLTYALVNAPASFAVHAESGQISTTGAPLLDYEDISSYVLTVRVSDTARPCGRLQEMCPSLSNTGTVTLMVVDVNDGPVISSKQVKLVDENTGNNQLVGSVVVATDQDTRPEWRGLVYSIVTGEVPECRGLDAQNYVSAWLVLGTRAEGPFAFDGLETGDKLFTGKLDGMPDGFSEPAVSASVGKKLGGKTWIAYNDLCSLSSSCGNGCNTKGIDLDCHFYNTGSIDPATCDNLVCERQQAYAMTYLVNAGKSDKVVELRMSSNDGHMVWINGKQVMSKFTNHCYSEAATDDVATVTLRPGVNRVLVRAQDQAGSWGFALSLSDGRGLHATTESDGTLTKEGGFGGAAFEIDSANGQLSVKATEALNFEVLNEYTLRVRVVDAGSLSHEADVTVRVGDINERPRFAMREVRSVPENSKAGTRVGPRISAAEVDASQRLTYWMVGQERRFTIDGVTGQVSVVNGAVLDFEGVNSFDVTIYAKDSASDPMTHSVPLTIMVTDVNEDPVVLPQELSVSEEDMPAWELRMQGTTVCLHVADPDNKIGSVVSARACAASQQDDALPSQQFSMTTDGRIRIAEETSKCVQKKDKRLVVAECNYGLRDLQKFHRSERADGADTSAICLVNGDKECITSSGTLADARASAAQITVTYSPRPGRDVGPPIISTDVDGGQTSRLRYYIKTQDPSEPRGFTIDASTGQVSINEVYLNFERKTSYTLTVGAVDDGYRIDGTTPSPCDVDYLGVVEADGRCRLSAENTVVVRLTDVNETPLLLDTERDISENMPKDTFVGAWITGSDVDAGDVLEYAIVAGNDLGLFAIESCNGQLRVALPQFDYENRKFYELDIEISDKAGLKMIAKVGINVLDVNENPVCEPPNPVSVKENSVEDTLVGVPLRASDIDGGHTSLLRWTLTRGNEELRFKIDPVTAQVSVNNGGNVFLNYETRPVTKTGKKDPFRLTATATDVGLLPTQPTTTFAEKYLPHATQHVGCFAGARASIGWTELEGTTFSGALIAPAFDAAMAPDVTHAYAFDSSDCNGKDLVGANDATLKTDVQNTDGEMDTTKTPYCDADGLRLNLDDTDGSHPTRGQKQYVDLGTLTDINQGEFSAAMWIKWKRSKDAVFGYHARVFNLCQSQERPTSYCLFLNSHRDEGQMTWQVYNTGKNVGPTPKSFWLDEMDVNEGQKTVEGKWVHVVVTMQSNGYKKVYKNGQLAYTAQGSASMPNVEREIAWLGKSTGGSSEHYFAGHIRSFATWNRPLKDEDVTRLFQSSRKFGSDNNGEGRWGVRNPVPQKGRELPVARCAQAAQEAGFTHFGIYSGGLCGGWSGKAMTATWTKSDACDSKQSVGMLGNEDVMDVHELLAKHTVVNGIESEAQCERDVCNTQAPCSNVDAHAHCCKGYFYDASAGGLCAAIPMAEYAYARLTGSGYSASSGASHIKVAPANPLSGSTVLEVHLTDVNEPPRLVGGTMVSIAENSKVLTTIGLPIPAPDDDGDKVTFMIRGWFETPEGGWGVQRNGLLYDGTRRTAGPAGSGTPCQQWKGTVFASLVGKGKDPNTGALVDGLHSMCRNPDDDPNGPWCFTDEAQTQRESCFEFFPAPSPQFSFNGDTGQFSVRGVFDFETMPQFVVIITAEEKGRAAPLSTTRNVLVQVENVNEIPTIEDQSRTLREDINIDDPIGAPLVVFDQDNTGFFPWGQSMVVRVIAGDENRQFAFAVNDPTQLVAVAPFDYEAMKGDPSPAARDIELTVEVVDNGPGALTDKAISHRLGDRRQRVAFVPAGRFVLALDHGEPER